MKAKAEVLLTVGMTTLTPDWLSTHP